MSVDRKELGALFGRLPSARETPHRKAKAGDLQEEFVPSSRVKVRRRDDDETARNAIVFAEDGRSAPLGEFARDCALFGRDRDAIRRTYGLTEKELMRTLNLPAVRREVERAERELKRLGPTVALARMGVEQSLMKMLEIVSDPAATYAEQIKAFNAMVGVANFEKPKRDPTTQIENKAFVMMNVPPSLAPPGAVTGERTGVEIDGSGLPARVTLSQEAQEAALSLLEGGAPPPEPTTRPRPSIPAAIPAANPPPPPPEDLPDAFWDALVGDAPESTPEGTPEFDLDDLDLGEDLPPLTKRTERTATLEMLSRWNDNA